MNIMVVGLGSMGKRRIRLIKRYNSSFNIFGIDLNSERRKFCEAEFGMRTSHDIEKVFGSERIDCAFICSSPLTHNGLIHSCLRNDLHVFTELNLVADGYLENNRLANEKHKTLFLSSTFLYRAEVIKLKELISKSAGTLNYTYHVGQYLPDWHPWENYNNFFVGDKRTNGCREIFAIELPWILDAFGEIENFEVIKSKISKLNITYNDNYLVMLEHASGNKGLLAIDVLSRKPVRNLEVFGEDLYMQWDGSPDGLWIYDVENKEDKPIRLYDFIDQLQEYSKFVVENAYYNEIECFFKAINNEMKPKYSFEEDKKVLDLIDKIEA